MPNIKKRVQTQQQISIDRIASACIGIVGPEFPECISNQLAAYEASKPADEDLRAQQDMALWALWMFIASCFTVLVTGVGIYYVREMLEASRSANRAAVRAVEVTRDIGQAEVRAYLGIESLTFGVDNERNVFLRVSARNFGQSPAIKVQAVFKIMGSTSLPKGGDYERGCFEGIFDIEMMPIGPGSSQKTVKMVFTDSKVPNQFFDADNHIGHWSISAAIFSRDVFGEESSTFAFESYKGILTAGQAVERCGEDKISLGDVLNSIVMDELRQRWMYRHRGHPEKMHSS